MHRLLIQHGFSPAEIEDFMSHALVIKCPRRMVLLREGEIPRFFYWATKGIFRAGCTDKEGNDITHTFFSPETAPFIAVYGSLISQRPSLSFLECIEEGELMSWHYDYVKKLEETEVKWLRFMKKRLDIIFALRDVKQWQFYTLSREELYKVFVQASPNIVNRVAQHYIASYLGVSPEALSRIKKRLNKQKLEKKE